MVPPDSLIRLTCLNLEYLDGFSWNGVLEIWLKGGWKGGVGEGVVKGGEGLGKGRGEGLGGVGEGLGRAWLSLHFKKSQFEKKTFLEEERRCNTRGGKTSESLSEENCPLEALRGYFFFRNSHKKTSERSS